MQKLPARHDQDVGFFVFVRALNLVPLHHTTFFGVNFYQNLTTINFVEILFKQLFILF